MDVGQNPYPIGSPAVIELLVATTSIHQHPPATLGFTNDDLSISGPVPSHCRAQRLLGGSHGPCRLHHPRAVSHGALAELRASMRPGLL